MTSDIVIRPAERGDLPALGRLGAALVRMHHGFDERRFMAPIGDIEAGYAWFLGTQLGAADIVLFVAVRAEDAVVGYVYAGIEPESWKELRGPAGLHSRHHRRAGGAWARGGEAPARGRLGVARAGVARRGSCSGPRRRTSARGACSRAWAFARR